MTKDFQKELTEKIKEGVKPSHLRKSKSLDNIPTISLPITPLQKSKSQLEIPLTNQPSKDQQIFSLQDELTIERKKVSLLREDLAREQEKSKKCKEKITSLEEQILQLRLDKITEFGDYLEKKAELTQELEENITAGTQEIERLENQLKTVNKKKLELQQKLGTSESKRAQLELNLLDNPTPSTGNYWPMLTALALIYLSCWLLNKNPNHG